MKGLRMTFKEFRKNRVVKFISNKYFIITLLFIIWMLFFDENSYLNHRELNEEIEKLEDASEYYVKEIKRDSNIIENLNNKDSLEKYAREQYKMKRDNEDIYIIEYDSLKEN